MFKSKNDDAMTPVSILKYHRPKNLSLVIREFKKRTNIFTFSDNMDENIELKVSGMWTLAHN